MERTRPRASTAVEGWKTARVKPSGSTWVLERATKERDEKEGVNEDEGLWVLRALECQPL